MAVSVMEPVRLKLAEFEKSDERAWSDWKALEEAIHLACRKIVSFPEGVYVLVETADKLEVTLGVHARRLKEREAVVAQVRQVVSDSWPTVEGAILGQPIRTPATSLQVGPMRVTAEKLTGGFLPMRESSGVGEASLASPRGLQRGGADADLSNPRDTQDRHDPGINSAEQELGSIYAFKGIKEEPVCSSLECFTDFADASLSSDKLVAATHDFLMEQAGVRVKDSRSTSPEDPTRPYFSGSNPEDRMYGCSQIPDLQAHWENQRWGQTNNRPQVNVKVEPQDMENDQEELPQLLSEPPGPLHRPFFQADDLGLTHIGDAATQTRNAHSDTLICGAGPGTLPDASPSRYGNKDELMASYIPEDTSIFPDEDPHREPDLLLHGPSLCASVSREWKPAVASLRMFPFAGPQELEASGKLQSSPQPFGGPHDDPVGAITRSAIEATAPMPSGGADVQPGNQLVDKEVNAGRVPGPAAEGVRGVELGAWHSAQAHVELQGQDQAGKVALQVTAGIDAQPKDEPPSSTMGPVMDGNLPPSQPSIRSSPETSPEVEGLTSSIGRDGMVNIYRRTPRGLQLVKRVRAPQPHLVEATDRSLELELELNEEVHQATPLEEAEIRKLLAPLGEEEPGTCGPLEGEKVHVDEGGQSSGSDRAVVSLTDIGLAAPLAKLMVESLPKQQIEELLAEKDVERRREFINKMNTRFKESPTGFDVGEQLGKWSRRKRVITYEPPWDARPVGKEGEVKAKSEGKSRRDTAKEGLSEVARNHRLKPHQEELLKHFKELDPALVKYIDPGLTSDLLNESDIKLVTRVIERINKLSPEELEAKIKNKFAYLQQIYNNTCVEFGVAPRHERPEVKKGMEKVVPINMSELKSYQREVARKYLSMNLGLILYIDRDLADDMLKVTDPDLIKTVKDRFNNIAVEDLRTKIVKQGAYLQKVFNNVCLEFSKSSGAATASIPKKLLDLGIRERVWSHVNAHLEKDLLQEDNETILRRFVHLANSVGPQQLAVNADTDLMHKLYFRACQYLGRRPVCQRVAPEEAPSKRREDRERSAEETRRRSREVGDKDWSKRERSQEGPRSAPLVQQMLSTIGLDRLLTPQDPMVVQQQLELLRPLAQIASLLQQSQQPPSRGRGRSRSTSVGRGRGRSRSASAGRLRGRSPGYATYSDRGRTSMRHIDREEEGRVRRARYVSRSRSRTPTGKRGYEALDARREASTRYGAPANPPHGRR